MSLINQMLRDLDQRHAQSPAQPGVAATLRSAPLKSPPSRVTPLLWALAGALGGGAGAWLTFTFLNKTPMAPPPVPVPITAPAPAPAAPVAAPPPPAAPTPVPAALPALPESTPPVEPPKPATNDAKASRPPPKDAAKPSRATTPEPLLKLETGLGAPKKSERPPEPAPPPVSALATPKPPAAKAEPAPEGRIDKSQRGGANEAAEAEYRKAIALVKRGAVTEAVASFLVALRVDPRHVPARQALLSQLVEQRQLNEALNVAEEGLGVDPTQVGWAMLAARLYLERGEPTTASDLLARHAKHAEGNGDYAAFQALLFQRFKRYREAAERYQAALAVRADEGRWWYGLGLAHEGDHKAAEATAAFRKAREAGNLPPELAQSVEQRLR